MLTFAWRRRALPLATVCEDKHTHLLTPPPAQAEKVVTGGYANSDNSVTEVSQPLMQ